MREKKPARIYTQQQFNHAIRSLRGEQNGNTEYQYVYHIRRGLLQKEPKLVISKIGKRILKKELFSIASFTTHWRILVRQLVAVEILGLIAGDDPEIMNFLTGRLKDSFDPSESEALQNALDYINKQHAKPVMHTLLVLTRTIKKETPIATVGFTLSRISVLVEKKTAETLLYEDAREMHILLTQHRFTDAHINSLIQTILGQLEYIYPTLHSIT